MPRRGHLPEFQLAIPMTNSFDQSAASPAAVPRGAAAYLAVVQFLFALGWFIYVIYLPALAEQKSKKGGRS